MTVTFCIPVSAADAAPSRLVAALTAGSDDIEIVVAAPEAIAGDLPALSADPRLRLVTAPLDPGDLRALWRLALENATGDWVTLVEPGDMIEAGLAALSGFVEGVAPSADAIGWNTFQIDPRQDAAAADSVAVPTSFNVHTFEKTAMLKAFFYWQGSLDVPKVPFGVFHGLVRRPLLETMLAIPDAMPWTTPVPRFEWTAKTVLCADALVFCARPMSAINALPFDAVPVAPGGFPLHAGIGITAAVAEAQFYVLRSLGSDWLGAEADFIRACIIDCMKEVEPARFEAKARAYGAALAALDPALARAFQPQFRGRPPRDTRRGLHGDTLMVDRFLGGARDAQDFFGVVRAMIAPLDFIGTNVVRAGVV
ncbi:hypothetical protein [Ensifer soli]|uniref:hypothetical protein n=1 Tax=Ciceribacter sp. sgz301302 TaxID=3342379 RepID=UPI0035B8EB25